MDVAFSAVTPADLNVVFDSEIYRGQPLFSDDWFQSHCGCNDVDLARSPRFTVDGALAAAALLAFRGNRVWIGAFGVAPALRSRGVAREALERTLAIAARSGAKTVELEVLSDNAAAVALYERGGFKRIGELVVWSRRALGVGDALAPLAHDLAAIERVAHAPAPSWQREAPSVAAASPVHVFEAHDAARRAYAFVRPDGDRASVIDAAARDATSAEMLLGAIDVAVGARELILLNEPPHGALSDALRAHPAWSELARQYRMRVAVG